MKRMTKQEETALFGPEDHEAPIAIGPWFRLSGHGNYNGKTCIISSTVGPHWAGKAYIGEVMEEHSALVVAAPEMLKALKDLYEHCTMVHKHWGDGSNQKEADSAIAAGLAVIEKAEGGK